MLPSYPAADIGHCNDSTDMSYLTSILEKGVWLGLDRTTVTQTPAGLRSSWLRAMRRCGTGDPEHRRDVAGPASRHGIWVAFVLPNMVRKVAVADRAQTIKNLIDAGWGHRIMVRRPLFCV